MVEAMVVSETTEVTMPLSWSRLPNWVLMKDKRNLKI
jgi:hypothetical protein